MKVTMRCVEGACYPLDLPTHFKEWVPQQLWEKGKPTRMKRESGIPVEQYFARREWTEYLLYIPPRFDGYGSPALTPVFEVDSDKWFERVIPEPLQAETRQQLDGLLVSLKPYVDCESNTDSHLQLVFGPAVLSIVSSWIIDDAYTKFYCDMSMAGYTQETAAGLFSDDLIRRAREQQSSERGKRDE